MRRPSVPRNRGQVGIGTIIVLVAALLVAITTVGVFFEVAGSLQSDTAATSEGAADRFTGRLEVIAVTGTVQDGAVEVVNVTVGQASATGATDLRAATVQWVGPAGAPTLVWAGRTDGPGFGITAVRDADGSGLVLNDDRDRAVLTIDPGTGINATTTVDGETVDIEETGPALEPREQVTVDITTDTTTSYRIQVPVSLPDSGTVDL
jgi:flagellin FlaB